MGRVQAMFSQTWQKFGQIWSKLVDVGGPLPNSAKCGEHRSSLAELGQSPPKLVSQRPKAAKMGGACAESRVLVQLLDHCSAIVGQLRCSSGFGTRSEQLSGKNRGFECVAPRAASNRAAATVRQSWDFCRISVKCRNVRRHIGKARPKSACTLAGTAMWQAGLP